MIIVNHDQFVRPLKSDCSMSTVFCDWDDGDVHSMLIPHARVPGVPGTLAVSDDLDDFGIFENPNDKVRVIISRDYLEQREPYFEKISDQCCGWILRAGHWLQDDVQCVSIQHQLFSRFRGIVESDAIAGQNVFVVGVGSFGADVVSGLVKSGVTKLTLLDFDRVDVCNIMRHSAGLSHVGRMKTKVLKEMVLGKNPSATVLTYEAKVEPQNRELLRELIASSDIVVCAIDDQDGKMLINRLCVEEGKACIFAGAFRRAYGGQVLRVRPHQSLCYQCFLNYLPEQAANQEISNHRQADAISYSDRPVPVEPGLANDIAPITQMVCKLVIQELLKGKETTLRSLDEDVVAPLYMWFNRREKDTDQENWPPLAYDCNGMHVMRWYGASIEKDPACPVCGDFLSHLAAEHGLEIPREG